MHYSVRFRTRLSFTILGSTLLPPLLPQILEQAVPLPNTAEPKKAVSGAAATSSGSEAPAGKTGQKKVPKWFKIGQKK